MIATALAALVFSLLLTPLVARLCVSAGILDRPGPLKIHARPVPRLGGFAVVAAMIAASLIMPASRVAMPWPFVAGLVLICFTGLVDDIRRLSPAVRLAAQFLAASALWYAGWRIPVGDTSAWSILTTCIFVAAFANAFNFLDGADGIAAGTTAILALAYIALPVTFTSAHTMSIAYTLFGACLGFLLFNFPPATIFLGDCGSTALGFSAAFLALDFYRSSSSNGVNGASANVLAFLLLVAGLPLLDATLAVARRLKHAGSPFFGDRRHVYDLLLARGWAPRRVVLVCCSITATLALTGWLTLRLNAGALIPIACIAMTFLLSAAIRLGALRTSSEQKPQSSRRGWSAVP